MSVQFNFYCGIVYNFVMAATVIFHLFLLFSLSLSGFLVAVTLCCLMRFKFPVSTLVVLVL